MKTNTPFEKALYLPKQTAMWRAILLHGKIKQSRSKKKYFNSFFNSYLAVPQPTLGHYRGAALLTRC